MLPRQSAFLISGFFLSLCRLLLFLKIPSYLYDTCSFIDPLALYIFFLTLKIMNDTLKLSKDCIVDTVFIFNCHMIEGF